MRTPTACNDTYTRDAQGFWRYPWGRPVPSAIDLTLADRMASDATVGCTEGVDPLRPWTAAERDWRARQSTSIDHFPVRQRPGHRPHAGDLIVGMSAPKLHAMTMSTVADLAQAVGVSKSTIDSYRYRSLLPQQQITRSRTPLWSRPIVRRWREDRPGAGWRSNIDVDGSISSAANSTGRAGRRDPRHGPRRVTAVTTPSTASSPPTRSAIILAGVFVASMIGTFALWATIEPDCSRSGIVAFEAACADAITTP